MHLECLQRGIRSTRASTDYLLGERDARERRDGVEVLCGEPDIVAAVADSLEFEHEYRSVAIARAPEDPPTDALIEAVLDEFEKTAWAGLEPDRYSWTAVPHRERGGVVHRARPDRPVGPGDGPQPRHRAARLGARPSTRPSR